MNEDGEYPVVLEEPANFCFARYKYQCKKYHTDWRYLHNFLPIFDFVEPWYQSTCETKLKHKLNCYLDAKAEGEKDLSRFLVLEDFENALRSKDDFALTKAEQKLIANAFMEAIQLFPVSVEKKEFYERQAEPSVRYMYEECPEKPDFVFQREDGKWFIKFDDYRKLQTLEERVAMIRLVLAPFRHKLSHREGHRETDALNFELARVIIKYIDDRFCKARSCPLNYLDVFASIEKFKWLTWKDRGDIADTVVDVANHSIQFRYTTEKVVTETHRI